MHRGWARPRPTEPLQKIRRCSILPSSIIPGLLHHSKLSTFCRHFCLLAPAASSTGVLFPALPGPRCALYCFPSCSPDLQPTPENFLICHTLPKKLVVWRFHMLRGSLTACAPRLQARYKDRHETLSVVLLHLRYLILHVEGLLDPEVAAHFAPVIERHCVREQDIGQLR